MITPGLRSEHIRAALPGLVVLGVAGCAALPPPPDIAAPIERTTPQLPSTPAAPPAGRGLVIIDSVSGPARATRIVAPAHRRTEEQASALLCSTTPCAAYLPYGTQQVRLESNADAHRGGTYPLDVTDRPLVLRASLDAEVPAGRARVPGAVLMVSGLGCMTVGVTMVANQEGSRSDQGLEAAGWATLGVGAAVAILGGILWSNGAPVHYEGHAAQWTLEQGAVEKAPPAAPGPPASP